MHYLQANDVVKVNSAIESRGLALSVSGNAKSFTVTCQSSDLLYPNLPTEMEIESGYKICRYIQMDPKTATLRSCFQNTFVFYEFFDI